MKYLNIPTTALCLALTACGGGGSSSGGAGGVVPLVEYSGTSSAATLDSTTQDDFAEGADTVVVQAIEDDASDADIDSLPTGLVASSSEGPSPENLAELVLDTVGKTSGNLPIGASESIEGSCGGSATFSGSETSYTINYDDYCEYGVISDGTINGSSSVDGNITSTTITYVDFAQTTDGSEWYTVNGTYKMRLNTDEFYVEYSAWNLTYTTDGDSYTISGSETCSDSLTCTFASNYTGDNGEIYKVEGLTVSINNSLYSVSATFYHPDHGYVELESTGVSLCDDGSIGSGSITLTDDDGSVLEVDYNGCGVDATVTLTAAE